MSLPNTDTAHRIEERAQDEVADINQLLDARFPPGTNGRVWISTGIDPYWNEAKGKYEHRDWQDRPFDYPAQREDIIDHFLVQSHLGNDAYMCGGYFYKERSPGSLQEIHGLFLDWDGTPGAKDLCRSIIRGLHGYTIESGTEGHLQCHIPTAPITTAGRYTELCEAVAKLLPPGCDSKKACNDVFRLPGTDSHKSVVTPGGTGTPTPVRWLDRHTGIIWELDALAHVLGVDSAAQEAAGATNTNGSTFGTEEKPPFDLSAYPGVAAALANPKLKADGVTVDRSETLMAVVGACVTSNLELAHIRWAVNQRQDLREKLAEQKKNRDDVLICYVKASDSRQKARRERGTPGDFFGPNLDDGGGAASGGGGGNRILTMQRVSEIADDIADWVWEHEGEGRIQRGVFTIFGGRPGAGKSTAARWFAARASRGELDGIWKGQPQNVAYIASEESTRYVIKPGLRAAGADMNRILMPTVEFNSQAVGILAEDDERELTRQLVAEGVTWVFLDPVMSTIKSKVDIYRNNEMRQALAPWGRIAEKIDGAVVGIMHLNKGQNGDVVAALNGSSAIGEVARCVFGFAKDPEGDDDRVMSQVKNSCGREDLSLTYEIQGKVVTTDAKRKGVMPLFAITGDSDTNVSEILNTGAQGRRGAGALQPVLNLVNSRVETTADDVRTAGLAKDNKLASQMLTRLYKRGLIDRPIHGSYTPMVKASKGGQK